MKKSASAIFIPARLNSSRFPRKILTPIFGKPLIIRVLERAQNLKLGDCYVACCCEEIKNIVEAHGGKAILTDPNLPSGTDRIFAAASSIDEKPEFIINLQGDNPVFDESIIPSILNVLTKDETIDMTTPVVLKKSLEDAKNENIVKVVFNDMENDEPGKAIYFSRNYIPNGADYFYAHIGIYAYRYKAIEKFVALAPTYLEKTERLEQLRAIQNDMNIWAVPVEGISLSVDTKEDLIAVEEYLKNTAL
ncbi:MAG: 3-deoxy-manno-octulosonate cytidylyltransferase [Holosporales bacterium]|jgi:3-deoxy-manno-octulosonate cytidylyltransferase (CMP-KDO synthetase)|nr:3-deoxy-manno-octulosonate cytidylyltransferase [Holosporales bacterium]